MVMRNITPILDFQSVKLADQYWLGVQYGMQQSDGPQSDRYLIENLTHCIMASQLHPVAYYLGAVHGSILDPRTCELRSQVSTLVTLTDSEVSRGYSAGRVWFFVSTETDQERRLSDMLVMQRVHELATEEYREQETEGALDGQAKEPEWREWDVPTLRQTCIQANANVVKLEPSEDSSFDYWLKISTLDFRKLLAVPVKLAGYHRKVLASKTINTSVQLNRRDGGWWLTLSYDEVVPVQTESEAPVVGIDIGVANFITTSDGKHYGTFHGKLRERQKRDRAKRRRKAKLRACLDKKGVENLPSTTSRSGQRLTRHVRQEINRAVNECFADHPNVQFAYEHLSIATMKHRARAMNAYMRASNLAHIPRQIAWNAAKRGVQATRVKSAYSSQECSVCHSVEKKNRPDQQTFADRVCGHSAHADLNASLNIQRRVGDTELRACKDRKEVKVVLLSRHAAWKKHNGWP